MTDLKRIVHVDDDEDILEITRMALEVVDTFELFQFSSASAALAELDAINPDLLLLDVMMPDMTGPEMWDIAKPRPAIFMTAKAEERLSQDLMARGALGVVTKPFDPMQLGARIRETWARFRPTSDGPVEPEFRPNLDHIPNFN